MFKTIEGRIYKLVCFNNGLTLKLARVLNMVCRTKFTVDYCKSERTTCGSCEIRISKKCLRFSLKGKGRSGWYHWSCFFSEHCPASVEDIKDFEVLSWVDRRRIRERIEFLVDCANADTGICHLCQDKIPERAVRISKKGLGEFHLGCFSNERALLDYQLSSGDMLQGYTQLEAQDQLAVQSALPLVAVLELGPRSEPNWIQLPDTTEVTEVHLHFKNTTLG